MNTDKNQWIRFEDGLLKNEYIEKKFAKKNSRTYTEFYKQCCDHKSAEERRIVLIFLGTDTDKNQDPTKKMILENIMNSCNLIKWEDRKLLTVAAVRCEDPAIADTVDVESLKLFAEEADYTKTDNVRKRIDEGKRVLDSRKRSLWCKWILGGEYWYSIMQENKRRFGEWALPALSHLSMKTWCRICIFIVLGVIFVQQILGSLKAFTLFFDIFFELIAVCGWIALNQEEEETYFFRKLNLPVIFFNDTGSAQGWMKSYIKSYIGGGKGKKPSKPIFYIGMDDIGLISKKIHGFVIPKEYPNWGWVCLCKLVRDLADNPWGEIKLKTNVEDKLGISSAHVQTSEEKRSQDLARTFRMPEQEYDLWNQIEQQKGEYWNYAKIHEKIHERSEVIRKLFPIGKSVYVIYKNKEADFNRLDQDVINIMGTLLKEREIFPVSLELQFWIIVQDEVEQKVIETLEIILNQPSWNSNCSLWPTIWKHIVGLLIKIENQENWTIMKKLCDETWIQQTFQNQTSFDVFYWMEHEKSSPNVRRRDKHL